MIIPSEISLRQRKEFKKRFAVGESLASIIDSIATLDDLHSFLASRLLFKAEKNERLALMKRIEQKFESPGVNQVLKFLQYAFDLAEQHLSDAKRHAATLSAEDLVLYVENIVTRIDDDSTAPDGVKYPEKIIDSMRSHMYQTLVAYWILFSARRFHLQAGQHSAIANMRRSHSSHCQISTLSFIR